MGLLERATGPVTTAGSRQPCKPLKEKWYFNMGNQSGSTSRLGLSEGTSIRNDYFCAHHCPCRVHKMTERSDSRVSMGPNFPGTPRYRPLPEVSPSEVTTSPTPPTERRNSSSESHTGPEDSFLFSCSGKY